MCVYSLLYIVISFILDTLSIPCLIHQCMYSLCISLVVMHNDVVHGVMCLAQPHPPRPSDERPPVMYGHFCLVPMVSDHRRYYCKYFQQSQMCNSGDIDYDVPARNNVRKLFCSMRIVELRYSFLDQ